MWPFLYLPNVINLVVFEIPVAVSVFFHLNTGGSVASLVPYAHLALRMGWGAAIPYFNMKSLYQHARLDPPPGPVFDDIAKAHVLTSTQHRTQVLLARKHQDEESIEWGSKGRELALYRPYAFQPVCVPRITNDIVEWTPKERKLAVIGLVEHNPVCLPRNPTDITVWRLEDRELAIIPSASDKGAGFDFRVEHVDDQAQSELYPLSSILLLALAVGSGVVGGTCQVLATGQGLDWASVLADGNVAELARASQSLEDDGGPECIDDVDMSGSTIINASPVPLKSCLKRRPRIPRFLPPMLPPIFDRPSRIARAVYDARLPRGQTGFPFGTNLLNLQQPIHLHRNELLRKPPRPEPFFRLDALPPIPEYILDIVPKTTLDLQSLVKACITDNCQYENPPPIRVQQCVECQTCTLAQEQLPWSNKGSHFERLMDYMDASLVSLASVIYSSVKVALVVGWVAAVLELQSYARVMIKGHNDFIGCLVSHLFKEEHLIRFLFWILLLVNGQGMLASLSVYLEEGARGNATARGNITRRRFRVFDVTSKSPNMLRMEAAASIRRVRFKFDPEDTGRGVPKPRPRPSSLVFLDSPNQNLSPVPIKDPLRGDIRRRAKPSDASIIFPISDNSPSRSFAG